MFAFIKGSIQELNPSYVVIETHGIGYQVFIPLSSYSKLLHHHENITLYTSYVVREDSQRLFGFLDKAQKELFESLSDVSGIGPKTALSIIGHIDLKDFHTCIMKADMHTLSKIPGIGKKTAERLIVEMKDKLGKLNLTSQLEDSKSLGTSSIMKDALSALMNLGYQQQAAQKALKKVEEISKEPLDLATLITQALKTI